MAHIRTKIRKLFVSLLKGKTIAGNNVFDTRSYHLTNELTPAIIIYNPSEEITTETISRPRLYLRKNRINIEIYMQNDGSDPSICQAKLDDLSENIEQIILKTEINKSIKDVKDSSLESIEITNHSEDQQTLSIMTMGFIIFYQTKI